MDRIAQHMWREMRGSWFGDWGRRLSAPLGQRRRQTSSPEHHSKYQVVGQMGHGGVGFGVGVCIAINLVMGSGFLALPKAYVSAGLILGTAVTFVCMALLGITAGYESEVMCRAQAWANANVLPLVHSKGAPDSEMRLSTHAFQVSEMCEMFGGRKLQRAYNVLLFLYMFCALWGYATVFGEALATYAPLPFLRYTGAYRLYVMIFGAVVVPLSCMGIKEQALFQIVLTILRFAALLAMVGSIAVSLYTGGDPFGPESDQCVGTVELIHWQGIFRAVPAAIFALSLASTVPTIVSGLEDKHSVGNVTWTAQASAAVAYTCISLSTVYYFGKSVNGSCNINWVLYHPGANGLWTPLGAFLGRAVAYFVVFFPALDVTSVYPLNVMVVANNVMATVYSDHVDSASTDPVVVTTFRIACAMPPLLCALFVRDFAAIVGFGGNLAIMIAFVIPAYLNLLSQKLCEERFGASRTPFTGDVVSSTPALHACMVLGALLFVGLVGSDIASFLGGSV
ncbi:unnamed protein product [Ascophyllum nodosum]